MIYVWYCTDNIVIELRQMPQAIYSEHSYCYAIRHVMSGKLPVNSVPPVVSGGPHCSVTLLLVISATDKFVGADGEPTEPEN